MYQSQLSLFVVVKTPDCQEHAKNAFFKQSLLALNSIKDPYLFFSSFNAGKLLQSPIYQVIICH